MLGASRYNADERVFASLAESFPGINWKQLADYMVGRVVVHGERRAREMEEVAATLREIDIEPIMAEAIVRRMDWSVEAGSEAAFRRRSAQELSRRGGRRRQENGRERTEAADGFLSSLPLLCAAARRLSRG